MAEIAEIAEMAETAEMLDISYVLKQSHLVRHSGCGSGSRGTFSEATHFVEIEVDLRVSSRWEWPK